MHRLGHQGAGLQRLCAEVLHLHLPKPHSIRCGDWEASRLSAEQEAYAASDASVAVSILTALHAEHCRLENAAGGDGSASGGSASEDLEKPARLQAWCLTLMDQNLGGNRRSVRRAAAAAAAAAEYAEARALAAAVAAAPLEPLNREDVAAALASYGIEADLLRECGDEPASGVDVARWLSLEVEGARSAAEDALAIKSLALFARDGEQGGAWQPLVAVLPATHRLDLEKVGHSRGGGAEAAGGDSRRSARLSRLASPDECCQIFGYVPGTVPPLGHRAEVPVLVDTACTAHAVLLAGAGSKGWLLKVSTRALLSLPFVRAADVSLEEEPDPRE